MAQVLILIADEDGRVQVDFDLSPPPGPDPTPAQRLALQVADHLRARYSATDEAREDE